MMVIIAEHQLSIAILQSEKRKMKKREKGKEKSKKEKWKPDEKQKLLDAYGVELL